MLSIPLKKRLTSNLFALLIIANLLLVLLPAWQGSFIWQYISDVDVYFKLTGYAAILINFGLSIVIILLNTKFDGKWLLLFCFLTMSSFTLSMFQSDFSFKLPEGFMAFGVYIVLVCVLPTYAFSNQIRNITLILFLIWAIVPIFYFFLAPVSVKMLFYAASGGTFSGFALHRNFYGVYTGIAFILLTFVEWRTLYKYPLYILLLIGLGMSESRTVLLCLLVSLAYKKYSSKRLWLVYLGIVCLIGFLVYFLLIDVLADYTMRKDLDSNAREELYWGFWNVFLDNPLLGKGKDVLYFSSHYPEGSPAHNLILQALASYGMVTTFFFLIFLILIYINMEQNGRVLFLFLLITAMFQPYVDTGFPTALTVIVLLLGQMFSNKNKSVLYVEK